MASHKPAPLILADFDLSPERGFLPPRDPLAALSEHARLDEMGRELPKLLAARQFRSYTHAQKVILPESEDAQGLDALRCAARTLSFAGHGYVWEEPHRPADRIPAALAVPWCRVMKQLGRPPVLSYASYALDNWRRLDPAKPIELGNIVLLQNFFGGLDEEWFVLIHVDIEAKAGAALAAVAEAINAALADDPEDAARSLRTAAAAEERMYNTLLRMPEGCDPYVYFHRVRPYIHGWKDNPSLPHGVVYEGVEDFHGKPQHFRGETGAQSSIIPSLDAALGVRHEEGPLTHYLLEMREYMPPSHRALILALERLRDEQGRPLLLGYVRDRKRGQPALWEAYAECVRGLARFRETHYDYADRYIHQQSQRSLSNPTGVGTGGTPFMVYLKKHLDETLQLLDA
jgi:indoleamine 2,3-dioxygenase